MAQISNDKNLTGEEQTEINTVFKKLILIHILNIN